MAYQPISHHRPIIVRKICYDRRGNSDNICCRFLFCSRIRSRELLERWNGFSIMRTQNARLKEVIAIRRQRFEYLRDKEEYYRKLKEEQWLKLAELIVSRGQNSQWKVNLKSLDLWRKRIVLVMMLKVWIACLANGVWKGMVAEEDTMQSENQLENREFYAFVAGFSFGALVILIVWGLLRW